MTSMTTTQRPQRYTDLVQQLDGQRRAPVVPGSWVVVAAEDLAGGAGISLAKVVGGPSYTHAEGVAIQAVWLLHDGREIPQLRLTAVELSELLDSATDTLRWLRNGVHPDRIMAEILRAHRSAALARRTLDETVRHPATAVEAGRRIWLEEDDLARLRALVSVSRAIAELDDAWREMVRSRLPNLVRSLYLAGALEISRRSGGSFVGWEPGLGEPHPAFARLAPADLAAMQGMRAPATASRG